MVSFHALRHTRASALIVAGLDAGALDREARTSRSESMAISSNATTAQQPRQRKGDKNEGRTVIAVLNAFRGQCVANSASFQQIRGS